MGTTAKIAIAGGVLIVAYLVVSKVSSTPRAPATGATGGNKPSDLAFTSGLFSAGAALLNSLRTPATQTPPIYGGSPNLWNPALSAPASSYNYAQTIDPYLSDADASSSNGVVPLAPYEVYGPAAPT